VENKGSMKNTVAAKDPQRIVVSLELTGQARELADFCRCIEPPVSGSGTYFFFHE
jgi:hypothetical protein